MREARQQERHSGDIPVVFAGLIGAAVDDVIDLDPFDLGVAAISALSGRAARSSVRMDERAPP